MALSYVLVREMMFEIVSLTLSLSLSVSGLLL